MFTRVDCVLNPRFYVNPTCANEVWKKRKYDNTDFMLVSRDIDGKLTIFFSLPLSFSSFFFLSKYALRSHIYSTEIDRKWSPSMAIEWASDIQRPFSTRYDDKFVVLIKI